RHERDTERERYPLDPLSRDSWRDEAEARYGAHVYRDFDDERRDFNDRWQNSYSGPGHGRFGREQDDRFGRGQDDRSGRGQDDRSGRGQDDRSGHEQDDRSGRWQDESDFVEQR